MAVDGGPSKINCAVTLKAGTLFIAGERAFHRFITRLHAGVGISFVAS
jgi:hypothetical protein